MLRRFKILYSSVSLTVLAGIFGSLQAALATQSNASQALGGLVNAGNQAYGGGQAVSSPNFDGSLIHVLNFLLSFLGIIFFLLMIYAGYLWMTARGEEEQVMKAKKIIREAVTAIIIILAARLFTEFLLRSIGEAVQNS